jgi:anaerobic selenocysteine-containing dehydrogenase
MVRTRPKGERDPGWQRISWDEAMALTASRLEGIKARYGPEAVVFGCATIAGTSAADFFPWVQRLANAFGSPNFLYANHICAWHRGGSALYTCGGSMPQPDYEHTRCMLLWGYNPQASQPADAMRLTRSVGPCRTALTGVASRRPASQPRCLLHKSPVSPAGLSPGRYATPASAPA